MVTRENAVRRRPLAIAGPPRPVADKADLLAEQHERRTALYEGWREQLIDRLDPRRGDTVLDISCGPGLNFAALQARIGPRGRIIGIDDSPELLEVAARRVHARGWRNVDLVCASPATGERSVDPGSADGALLCAAHDALQSPAGLARVLAALRPGARVVAGGWKWPSNNWLLWPLRACVTALYGPLIADFSGFERPWRLLADHIPDLQVTQLGFGVGYLAQGTIGRKISGN
jgi:demethylmenaquinone methyltransferase/2-methoxy-6-polyprenyl-1,4-benzoquinol methylase